MREALPQQHREEAHAAVEVVEHPPGHGPGPEQAQEGFGGPGRAHLEEGPRGMGQGAVPELVAQGGVGPLPAVRLQLPGPLPLIGRPDLLGRGARGQLPAAGPARQDPAGQGLLEPGNGPGEGIRRSGAGGHGDHLVAPPPVEAQGGPVPVELDPVAPGLGGGRVPGPGHGFAELAAEQVLDHQPLELRSPGAGAPEVAAPASLRHRAGGLLPAGVPADPAGDPALAVAGLPDHLGLDHLPWEEGQGRLQQQQPAVRRPGHAPGEPLQGPAPGFHRGRRFPICLAHHSLPGAGFRLAVHCRHPPRAP